VRHEGRPHDAERGAGRTPYAVRAVAKSPSSGRPGRVVINGAAA